MPVGIVKRTGSAIVVRLLENIAAANTIADGAAGDVLRALPSSTQFFRIAIVTELLAELGYEWPDDTSICLYETAGSGTMTLASAKVLLYDGTSQKMFPAGTGGDTTKGMLNSGAAFGETSSDKIRHTEPILYVHHFDGIAVELGTFGGTAPTFNVEWRIPLSRRATA